MILRKTPAGVPVGSYNARLSSYNETDTEWGARLRWEWEVDNGEQKGAKSGCLTATSPTPGNSCGRILDGLLGRDSINQDIDLDSLIGKKCIINVKAGKNGGTFVDSVVLPPT